MDNKFEQVAKIIEICDAKDIILKSDFDSLHRKIEDLENELKEMRVMRVIER
jgi:polyhydroxyalkanoate synthesis regulator phasin